MWVLQVHAVIIYHPYLSQQPFLLHLSLIFHPPSPFLSFHHPYFSGLTSEVSIQAIPCLLSPVHELLFPKLQSFANTFSFSWDTPAHIIVCLYPVVPSSKTWLKNSLGTFPWLDLTAHLTYSMSLNHVYPTYISSCYCGCIFSGCFLYWFPVTSKQVVNILRARAQSDFSLPPALILCSPPKNHSIHVNWLLDIISQT